MVYVQSALPVLMLDYTINFLVVKSSINLLIYCSMSSQYRNEGKVLVRKMMQKFAVILDKFSIHTPNR